MRRNSLRSLVLFFLLTVSAEIRLPLFSEASDSPSTSACLYVASGLPACSFERYKRSTEATRTKADSSDKNFVLFTRKRLNDTSRIEEAKYSERHVTVYVLERCLPSRLPFRMTLCDSKDVLKTANEVWKLFPFKVRGLSETPFVFPRLRGSSSSTSQWIEARRRISRERREIEGAAAGVTSRSERRKTRNVEVGSEFPYWKAIPYDPKKLGFADSGSGTFPHRIRKLRDALRGRKLSVEEYESGIANERGEEKEEEELRRSRREEKRHEDRSKGEKDEKEEVKGHHLSKHLLRTSKITSSGGRRRNAVK